ncbi:MAG TPA: GyrI-like domain-containing protein [Thermoplasmata archaeon]|jgi:effector-binding domain-containing protein
MTVDFVLKKTPSLHVAAIRWTGPYNERQIQKRFEEVEKWARARGLRTGRWIFREPGSRVWDTAIEVRGKARSEGRVKVRTLPAGTVASVRFDPDVVSPRVVYHGLSDWLRWRRKEKEIRSVVSYREVYEGNPWKDKRAWSRTEVQFVVRK